MNSRISVSAYLRTIEAAMVMLRLRNNNESFIDQVFRINKFEALGRVKATFSTQVVYE